MRRPLIVAGTLSTALLTARYIFPVAALSDPAGGMLPAGAFLHLPVLNLILAPLFDLWDGVTLLSLERLNYFLVGTLVLGAAWSITSSLVDRRLNWTRATARLAIFVGLLGLFVVTGMRWQRPMARLDGVALSTWWVADLHSHTTVSHDVKGLLQEYFDLDASRAWHARGGYSLFFVTDHNRIDGWQGKVFAGTPVVCPGEELSLWKAHIVLLGNRDSVPRGDYADSMSGILRLFGESESRWGALTLASLPEYDENHFDLLPLWLIAGVDGFEISNPAPKANRQSRAHVDSVVALARQSGRWVAGVTDQHGMGGTPQAWTLVPRENPETIGVDGCQEILHTLGTRGFAATQVIERHRLRPDAWWPYWTTPVAVVWEGWRSAQWMQVASWFAWIWGVALIAVAARRKAAA